MSSYTPFGKAERLQLRSKFSPSQKGNQCSNSSGVSKIHQAGEVQTTALDRIDLEIAAGEYVAITGPSGCGKSTLLSVLGLLDVPNLGEYWFEGQNVAGWSEARLNALRRGKVGFIFQSFNLIEELSVFENVELALEYTARRRKNGARVTAMLERWASAHRAGTALRSCPAASSSGWRSRARWWPVPPCCWPTNRPATSTPRTATKSCACCARLTPKARRW
jgi:predicted ABC-type transport system involved in lysophospholipase L1 biosynthesis ATPase subunit